LQRIAAVKMQSSSNPSGVKWARRRALGVTGCTLVLCLVVAEPARAQDTGVARERTAAKDRPIRRMINLDGWLGPGLDAREKANVGTANLGVTALVQPSFWTLGAGAEIGGEILGPGQEFVGALGGTSLELTPAFKIDILAELGAHFYQPSTGMDLFGHSEIVSGDRTVSLPYAGLRVGPALLIGSGRRARFLIGAWLNAREDIGHTEARYTVQTCGTGFFGEEYSCSLSQESDHVGGYHLSAGLRVGVEFGARVD
jgi:hypothetical protein